MQLQWSSQIHDTQCCRSRTLTAKIWFQKWHGVCELISAPVCSYNILLDRQPVLPMLKVIPYAHPSQGEKLQIRFITQNFAWFETGFTVKMKYPLTNQDFRDGWFTSFLRRHYLRTNDHLRYEPNLCSWKIAVVTCPV